MILWNAKTLRKKSHLEKTRPQNVARLYLYAVMGIVEQIGINILYLF